MIEHRSLPEVEARVVQEVPDVVYAAGGHVVQGDDGVTAGQEHIREMGSDEPGAAGDENLHEMRADGTWGM